MKQLFLKIFLGFWLTTLLVMVGMHQLAKYFAETPLYQRSVAPQELRESSRRLFGFAEELFYSEGGDELEEWIEEHGTQGPIRIYLLPSEEAVPADVRHFASQLSYDSPRIKQQFGHHLYIGRWLTEYDDGVVLEWQLVMELPAIRPVLVHWMQNNLWLRFLLAMTLSAALCFLLVKLWTRPVDRLRRAAQQLAAGDLDTRVAVKPRSRDALAQLGRDFNFMAEQLQGTIDDQRQLLRDISHELRSPLGRIEAALELYRAKQSTYPTELERIERETHRLNEMIEQLLVIPDQQLALEDVIDLSELVATLIEETQPQADHLGLTLAATLAPSLTIHCHAESLYRAIDNILRNALRHSPEGSTIEVATGRSHEAVWVTIRDHGVGVPEAELEKIFEVFYRVEQARDRDSGGYGLGLSIAQRAVLQHHGEISARNAQPGLSVSIRLPLSLLSEGDL